ncbi:MAG: response regulator transcription factor [Polyangiaceae bacterium]|nr:response regulator transcription factor [Polyangiaceae bacterium]
MQRHISIVDLLQSSRLGAPRPSQSGQVGPNLTRRQTEIARLLSTTGLSYKEVASCLGISEGTMRKHAENVYRRIGVHSRAELMIALSQELEARVLPRAPT